MGLLLPISLVLGQLIFPNGSVQTSAYNLPSVIMVGDSHVVFGYGLYDQLPSKWSPYLYAHPVVDESVVWFSLGTHQIIDGISLEDFKEYMEYYVGEWRIRGKRLVWGTMLENPTVDVTSYNEVALEVMYDLGVPVYDINQHDLVISADGLHMTSESAQFLGMKVKSWVDENIL